MKTTEWFPRQPIFRCWGLSQASEGRRKGRSHLPLTNIIPPKLICPGAPSGSRTETPRAREDFGRVGRKNLQGWRDDSVVKRLEPLGALLELPNLVPSTYMQCGLLQDALLGFSQQEKGFHMWGTSL